LIENGFWREIRDTHLVHPDTETPVIFLDRDGTIIDHVHYIRDPGDVKLCAHAAEFIKAANEIKIPTILVTNQSAIGRGYFGWECFLAVQDRMDELLHAEGCHLSAVYACSDVPEKDGHPPSMYRKPQPGMLLKGASDFNAALARSWMIGDNSTDIQAGVAANVGNACLVSSGLGRIEAQKAQNLEISDILFRCEQSLADIRELIPEM
jgi:D-glycero-D-manno-heptose 1,7-bisphosphate phosphatase